MSFELPGAEVPEELSCRYGNSKMLCRGPCVALDKPYVAFLGGSETFGKFVEHPFVTLIGQGLDIRCVNLGSANAGLDAYVQDPDIMGIAAGAELVVIQIMGAQNLSNRHYRVHPRRNDRFLAASPLLSSIYCEVDLTEFNFNIHLLSKLHSVSPERFRIVQQELKTAWLARMRLLLRGLSQKPLLLWLRTQSGALQALGEDPLLVDQVMMDSLRSDLRGIVELSVNPTGESEELAGMQFGPMQAQAAAHMIGPQTHLQIANRLTEAIREILQCP